MKYPEHDKLSKVKDQCQWLGEFIEWLEEREMQIVEWVEVPRFDSRQMVPVHKPINQWLAEYFDIDLMKLEDEKLEMLKAYKK